MKIRCVRTASVPDTLTATAEAPEIDLGSIPGVKRQGRSRRELDDVGIHLNIAVGTAECREVARRVSWGGDGRQASVRF